MLAHEKPLRSPVFLPLGAGAALVALLPWAITGMRLPLQQLWVIDTLPDDMPTALLPFHQYYALTIAALIVIGSTLAGSIGRGVAAQHPRPALFALMGGVLLVQVGATVQSALVLSGGLEERDASTLYLAALVGGTVAAILLGLGMLALIARAPKPAALLALAVAAVAFGTWIGALLFPIGSVTMDSPLVSVFSGVAQYSPAIIIGLGIVWCGIQSAGRIVAAIASLAVLWVGPTLVTAFNAAAGTRVLSPYPAEMLEYGIGVFRMAIGMPELWLPPIALAVGIAVVGLVARRSVAARRAVAADGVSSD